MKNVFLFLVLFSFVNSFCQDDNKKDLFKNKGYFNITKFTYYTINNANLEFIDVDNSITRNDVKGDNPNGNSIQTINGYFISPNFSLGLGIGLERFNSPNANTLPIFLDARYYLENDYNSLYGYANAGFLSKLDSSFNKGGMLGAGVGYKFFINSNKTIALMSDIGFYHRLVKIPFNNNPNTSDLILNGFSFSIGTIF